MDLSDVRYLSPFNRQWYRITAVLTLLLIGVVYSMTALGFIHTWDVMSWIIFLWALPVGFAGVMLLVLDGKFVWAIAWALSLSFLSLWVDSLLMHVMEGLISTLL